MLTRSCHCLDKVVRDVMCANIVKSAIQLCSVEDNHKHLYNTKANVKDFFKQHYSL